MSDASWFLAVCMFFGAALYSSVGHAGASAYIALMALFGLAPAVMRPTALALNILVASFASFRYWRAGLFRWRVAWPFMLGAVPFAFVGGGIQLPGEYYRPLVGVLLLVGALRLLWGGEIEATHKTHDPPVWVGVVLGAGIGLLSGLTGTGGGIFLSPIVIFMGWSDLRTTSGIGPLHPREFGGGASRKRRGRAHATPGIAHLRGRGHAGRGRGYGIRHEIRHAADPARARPRARDCRLEIDRHLLTVAADQRGG
jgi:hypothetical protein